MWSVGEFADLLVQSSNSEDLNSESVTAEQIIDKCEEVLSSTHVTLITKEYTLNALTKLSVRFTDQASRVKQIVDFFGCSHSVELQQRAVEFAVLFSRHDQLRPSVYEKMPLMSRSEKRISPESEERQNLSTELSTEAASAAATVASKGSALLDLLDMSPTHDVESSKPSQADTTISLHAANDVLDLLGSLDSNPAPPDNTNKASDLNSLDTLFGTVTNSVPAPHIPVVNTNGTSSLLNNNIFDNLDSSPEAVKSGSDKIPPITAFEKNGLRLEFNFEKSLESSALTLITLSASNSSAFPVEDFLFQAAVPKVISKEEEEVNLQQLILILFVSHSNFN